MSLRQNSDVPFSSEAQSTSVISHNVSHEPEINSFVSRGEQPAELAVSRLRRNVPKAAYAVVPGVLFLGLGLATRNSTLSSPTSSTRSESVLQISGGNAILAASQTMIVPATTASPAMSLRAPATATPSISPSGSVVWRARLQPVVDVVGRAPITGQITRVWARPGQNVSVGDRVLRILSYSKDVVAAAPRRNVDTAAEDEQVQAVRAQSDLGTRLSQAQARLKAAQSRVTRAQSRVDEAMSVVRKLQSGAASETESDIEYSLEEAPLKNDSGINAAEVQAAQGASERASQAAENAKDEAAATEREASRAESEAKGKARRARELHQIRDTAKTTVSKAAKTSETADETATNAAAPVANPEVPSVSVGAVSEADSAARESASRAASLRSKANTAKTVADRAESRAQVAASRAKASLRSLQLFNDDVPTPRRKSSTRSSRTLPSLEEAARMVREATDESRKASRDAGRWKDEVDAYSRQARQTQQRLAASEQNLGSSQQNAQQQELETTLQRNLSVVRAPANGTIVQIGDVGDNVTFGDAILMVGKAGVLRAQFSDNSGLWRKLKPGSILSATVSMREDKTPKRATSSTRSLPNVSLQTSITNEIPVVARVEEVEQPMKKGAPALVKTTVRTVVSATMKPTDFGNAPNDSIAVKAPEKPTLLRAGMTIMCAIDSANLALNSTANVAVSNVTDGILVPQQAVVMLEDETSTRDVSEVSADSGIAARDYAASAYVAILRPDENGTYAIEWREVQAHPAPKTKQRLVRGLIAGERVVLDAAALRDLTLNYGNDAKITLRDNIRDVQEELK